MNLSEKKNLILLSRIGRLTRIAITGSVPVLVYDAWLMLGYKSVLFYGEVMTGVQSQNFSPTDYVDITGVVDQKHKACFVHVSQEIEKTYGESHGKMEVFRGMESGFGYAEAFIRQVKSPRNEAQVL